MLNSDKNKTLIKLAFSMFSKSGKGVWKRYTDVFYLCLQKSLLCIPPKCGFVPHPAKNISPYPARKTHPIPHPARIYHPASRDRKPSRPAPRHEKINTLISHSYFLSSKPTYLYRPQIPGRFATTTSSLYLDAFMTHPALTLTLGASHIHAFFYKKPVYKKLRAIIIKTLRNI